MAVLDRQRIYCTRKSLSDLDIMNCREEAISGIDDIKESLPSAAIVSTAILIARS